MNVVKPPRLRRGDLIGLISPASVPSSCEKIEKGVRYLEQRGYRVKVGRHAAAQHGYLAGTDAQRAEDLNGMLRAPEVKAIFCLRGGYGTPRLLPMVDYRAARRQPKILAGYSDITGLQLALFRRAGLVTFSAPMPAVEFWNNPDPYTEEHFWRMITSPKKIGPLPQPADHPLRARHPGKAEGLLLGGNLSLLIASLGTPYSPSYKNSLLVLEEIDEHLHRLDRMLTQVRNAGIFDQMSGLILGEFTDCAPSDPNKPHLTYDQMFEEVLDWVKKPAVDGFLYGHVPKKLTVPLGVRARLDATRLKIEVLEGAVV